MTPLAVFFAVLALVALLGWRSANRQAMQAARLARALAAKRKS